MADNAKWLGYCDSCRTTGYTAPARTFDFGDLTQVRLISGGEMGFQSRQSGRFWSSCVDCDPNTSPNDVVLRHYSRVDRDALEQQRRQQVRFKDQNGNHLMRDAARATPCGNTTPSTTGKATADLDRKTT